MRSDVRGMYPDRIRRPAVSITLHRATGPVGLTSEHTFDADNPWADADAQLRFWALSAPREGGHDRVDFIVDYGNDVSHRGSLDLTSDGADLATHMHGRLTHVINNPDLFDAHLDIDHLIALRDRCEIGRTTGV